MGGKSCITNEAKLWLEANVPLHSVVNNTLVKPSRDRQLVIDESIKIAGVKELEEVFSSMPSTKGVSAAEKAKNLHQWGWGRYVFSVEIAEWRESTGRPEDDDDEYASDDVTGS